jgi:hypothetical protein
MVISSNHGNSNYSSIHTYRRHNKDDIINVAEQCINYLFERLQNKPLSCGTESQRSTYLHNQVKELFSYRGPFERIGTHRAFYCSAFLIAKVAVNTIIIIDKPIPFGFY